MERYKRNWKSRWKGLKENKIQWCPTPLSVKLENKQKRRYATLYSLNTNVKTFKWTNGQIGTLDILRVYNICLVLFDANFELECDKNLDYFFLLFEANFEGEEGDTYVPRYILLLQRVDTYPF